jgi:Sulfotransferase domain
VSEASGARVPEFFVVGHQKSGTTALHLMLSQHPQVFLPKVKEPRYFAFDLRSSAPGAAPKSRPRTLEGYLALFADAREDQRIGEVSPQYLRSRVAAAEIARVQPQARIIAIMREPASFIRSFHMQMVSSKVESERDLRRALELEARRREGKAIPRGSHHPEALMYSEHVRYVEQLRRFEEQFPRERMLVLVYEDFRADNEATLARVLRFLELQEQAPLEPLRTEPLREVRSPALHRLAGAARRARRNPSSAGPLARAAAALAPAALRSERLRTGWRRAAYATAGPADERVMLELRARFKPEVAALGEHLGRDLLGEWGYDGID